MTNFFTLIQDFFVTSVRTKKSIIFLILYLVVFGLISYMLFFIQDEVNARLDAEGISKPQREFAMFLLENNVMEAPEHPEVVDFLIHVPFLNIALFLVSIMGTPLLILILGYDRIAQEVYDGTIRFLLFRVSRAKLFLAKFVSSAIETGLITFIALVVVLIWATFRLDYFDFKESFAYGMRYWAIAQVFLWFFIAFSQFFSSIFKKPFHALLLSYLAFFALVILPFWVSYVSPFDQFYLHGIFFDTSYELFRSLAFCMLFTGVFLGSGYYIFKSKDL